MPVRAWVPGQCPDRQLLRPHPALSPVWVQLLMVLALALAPVRAPALGPVLAPVLERV